MIAACQVEPVVLGGLVVVASVLVFVFARRLVPYLSSMHSALRLADDDAMTRQALLWVTRLLSAAGAVMGCVVTIAFLTECR